MKDETRRRELADFLRKRRENIDPANLGLHRDARRRTPGLRREEVAVLAGMSPTWYTYLEQARNVSPSPKGLDGIADVLHLSYRERVYLNRLAQRASPPEPMVATSDEDATLWWQLTKSLNPMPAIVSTRFGDVLSWNDAVIDWYTDFGRLPEGRRNLLRWIFTADEARERIVDWETEARIQVAQLRSAAAGWYGDPRLESLVWELTESSVHFRNCWNEHNVHAPGSRVCALRHARIGELTLRIVELWQDDSLRAAKLILHLPD